MKARATDYANALYESIAKQPDRVRPICQRFLWLLQKTRARYLLPIILEKLEEIELQKQHRHRIEITTVQKLEKEERNSISHQLEKTWGDGWTVELTNLIDPSILGGLKLRFEEKTIDHTIAKKLRDLASHF